MARPKRAGHMEDEGSSTGRWTTEEHQLFEDGLRKYGKQWKRIAEEIPTRTVVQIRTHAQKYFLKLAKIEPATSTSIALKPPAHHNRDRDHHHAGAGGAGVGHNLPLSLTRKKRASKSTYRRRSGGESDPDETESEQGKGAGAGEGGPDGEDDEEDAESWLTADDARHSYRSTKQTSSGRISRPPRKNAPGSPTITPRAGPSTRGKTPSAAGASALTAATPTVRGPHGASRASAPSGTANTTGAWGGAGPLSGLTVTIPPPRADRMAAAAAVGAGGMSPAGPYYHGGAAGAGKGLLGCQTTSQTPTSVAELYPEVGGGPYGGKLQAHRHRFHNHHHHEAAAVGAASGSSSATSSAASSLSPGRERQLLLSPAEALEYGGEDEGEDEDDLAFSKLEALAGRAAPEWAEALNEALGALEGGGVAANGQPHEHEELYAAAAAALHYHQHQHQHQHAVGPAYLGLSHAHAHAHVPAAYPAAERAGRAGVGRAGVGRHGSVGSLTDSQAGSSATSSYLPSDSDAGTNTGSEAAVPGGKDGGHFLALVDEHEHEDDLHQAAKRARLLGPPAPPTGAIPTAAAAFGVGKDGAAGGGGGAAPAAVAASSVVEQEEDYGYFTTEEELDQMLLGMLSHGPGGGVSAVGDARSWALDD